MMGMHNPRYRLGDFLPCFAGVFLEKNQPQRLPKEGVFLKRSDCGQIAWSKPACKKKDGASTHVYRRLLDPYVWRHPGEQDPLLFISFQSEMKFALDRNVYLPLKMQQMKIVTHTHKTEKKRVLSLSYSCYFSFPTKASQRLQLHLCCQLSSHHTLAKRIRSSQV